LKRLLLSRKENIFNFEVRKNFNIAIADKNQRLKNQV